jgi:hypothetical protein
VSIIAATVQVIRPLIRRGELLINAEFGLVHGTTVVTTVVGMNLDTGALVGAILG